MNDKEIEVFGLGQANKRNSKISITDIAISKVPYIEYKDMTNEQNIIMQRLAKEVLYLSKNINDSNEVAIIGKGVL